MAFYAIGDVHGNFDEFTLLLGKISFNPENDILWLVGDLINRGPKSLEMLRFAKAHQDSIHFVLGNHELHLLAAGYTDVIKKGKMEKGTKQILKAPDKDELLHWLRQQPLMLQHGQYAMVHAAVYPTWTIAEALKHAKAVETVMQGPLYRYFFENMYGNKPDFFSDELEGIEYLRMVVNIFTRTRFLNKNDRLDFDYKGTVADAPTKLTPWFLAENRQNLDHTIVFGHWSALGVYQGENVICLDSGAAWGGVLTAMNLDTKEIFQVDIVKKKSIFD